MVSLVISTNIQRRINVNNYQILSKNGKRREHSKLISQGQDFLSHYSE